MDDYTSRIHGRSLPKRRLTQRLDLLRELVGRDMKLLYKRSFFGATWTLISPLCQLAVFAFVFQVIIPVKTPNYTSFVFTGLIAWNWLQSSLYLGAGVIITNRPLIRQPGFPSAILPVVTTITGWIHYLLTLPVLICFLLMEGVELKPVILILPLLQLLQFFLTIGLAYFLAALNVTFRDIQHTLGVVLQLLFFLTPIFYSVEQIPERYRFLYNFNPMAHIVTGCRAVLMQGMLPDWKPLAVVAAAVLLCLPISLRYFMKQSCRFVEEL